MRSGNGKVRILQNGEEGFAEPESALPEFTPSQVDEALFEMLRGAIRNGDASSFQKELLRTHFQVSSLPQSCLRIFFVLYAPEEQRILVSRDCSDGVWDFASVFELLLKHPRVKDFSAASFSLQMDFVSEPAAPVDFYWVGMAQSGKRHFEIGIEGLEFTGKDDKRHFFLPGDAYVRSLMGMRQLRDYLHRSHGEDYMRNCLFKRLNSQSYLVDKQGGYRLYRGLPAVGSLTKDSLEHAVHIAIGHIKLNQGQDGKYLYYYDPSTGSQRDHEHPGRDPQKNPYYNILRHSGGALTCLYYEKYTRSGDTLDGIRAAIDYLLTTAVFYALGEERACYIYSEKKSKLGGAGIALYLLAEYQLYTSDDQYQYFADALAVHLISQITPSGEFIYYNIYLDEVVGQKENDKYFSFYYPGEAVCGLAKYAHLVPPESRQSLFEKMHLAMNYLVELRPNQRSEEYTEVPSDGWLMMGVMEMWDFPEMRRANYSDFVFSDAASMIDQMYKVPDSPYPDYPGAFYYRYNDYPYSDGARMEGLMGAYELACKMGEEELKESLWPALKLGAWSVYHLVNTENAIYCAKDPDMALGGIRFKYTRQWFRIDTIQHVASFYAKFLPYWSGKE